MYISNCPLCKSEVVRINFATSGHCPEERYICWVQCLSCGTSGSKQEGTRMEMAQGKLKRRAICAWEEILDVAIT